MSTLETVIVLAIVYACVLVAHRAVRRERLNAIHSPARDRSRHSGARARSRTTRPPAPRSPPRLPASLFIFVCRFVGQRSLSR